MGNLATQTTSQQTTGGVLTNATLANINTDLANGSQLLTLNLTLAQLLATNTAPVTLLPAQGAGTLIEVLSLTLDLVRGSAAFVGGGAVGAYLGTNSGGVLVSATIAATNFTTFPSSQIVRAAGAQAVAASSTILNTGLVLANPTADFTVGTGATGIIKLIYRVFTGLA